MTDPQSQPEDHDDLKTPFTFKLMVVLVVLYLGWRLVQGLVWVWQQIF